MHTFARTQAVLGCALMVIGGATAMRAGAQPADAKPAAPAKGAAEKVSPDARALLDRMTAHYAGLKTAKVKVNMATSMKDGEEEHKSDATIDLAFERPAKMAMSLKETGGEAMSFAFVSDGETLTQSMGAPFNKHSMSAAPKGVEGLLNAVSMGVPMPAEAILNNPMMLPLVLLDGARFNEVIKKADSVTLVGREAVGGVATDRIRISMSRTELDVWVRVGGAAWVERAVPDMSKMFADLKGMEDFKPPEMKMEITFTGWESPAEFGAETFKYTVPTGSEKVVSLAKAMRERPDASDEEDASQALLGKQAPELGLDLLDGGKATLASHRGKEVVMLDFWATWCPPCVKGLPIVSKVAAEFKDKGVVFYAVNEGETAAQVRKFLESKDLKITVAMDKSSKAGQAFKASGIPQTVLIAKDGTVQAIHAGLIPNLESELRSQLQTLVDGKALFVPAKEGALPAAANKGDTNDKMTLEETWSVRGRWSGVATDVTTGETFVMNENGRVVRVDRDGKEVGRVRLDSEAGAQSLRLANLTGDASPEIVTFGRWGAPVQAFDLKGTLLWEEEPGDGVDDVWTANVLGAEAQGHEQVIVGYNGRTGLHLLGGDGKAIWKDTKVGNVWHVSAGPTGKDGAMEVITTSAAGRVHVFDKAGKSTGTLRAGQYSNFVRVSTLGPGGAPVIIASDSAGSQLVGINREGKSVWKADIESDGHLHVTEGVCATDRPWIAITLPGQVLVFDTRTGDRIASGKTDGESMAWVPGKGENVPLLVFSSGSALRAWKLVEKKADEASKKEPAKAP